MDVLHTYDLATFMPLIPTIRANIGEWRMVEIKLTEGSNYNTPYIARKLKNFFGKHEGVIFICDQTEIIALARMGTDITAEMLSKNLVDSLPKNNGSMHTTAVTADSLLKIQVGLQEREKSGARAPAISPLLQARHDRTDDIVMVVDDDMFMRSLVNKGFGEFGHVIELENIADAVDTYLTELPDIVFLDVHMPGGSGIAALEEILMFDPTAHVVMLSSDTVKDTILDAKKYGAKGYVAKPFTPEKLQSCYNKCPTVLKKTEGS